MNDFCHHGATRAVLQVLSPKQAVAVYLVAAFAVHNVVGFQAGLGERQELRPRKVP